MRERLNITSNVSYFNTLVRHRPAKLTSPRGRCVSVRRSQYSASSVSRLPCSERADGAVIRLERRINFLVVWPSGERGTLLFYRCAGDRDRHLAGPGVKAEPAS